MFPVFFTYFSTLAYLSIFSQALIFKILVTNSPGGGGVVIMFLLLFANVLFTVFFFFFLIKQGRIFSCPAYLGHVLQKKVFLGMDWQ